MAEVNTVSTPTVTTPTVSTPATTTPATPAKPTQPVTPEKVTRANRKVGIKKAKVNIFNKAECIKELARLAQTNSDLSKYADDIRDRLAELK